eukprot:GHRQ01007936.1.p1 GENE.GHRQ01007936.1~~GHRQ01007936.1.p1  ORF type:complete len:397 (+),score=77.04 GHRQ01007936.1:714-1904(+)
MNCARPSSLAWHSSKVPPPVVTGNSRCPAKQLARAEQVNPLHQLQVRRCHPGCRGRGHRLLVATASAAAGSAGSQGGPSALKLQLLALLQAHYLPLLLVTALLLGAVWPSLGVAAAKLQIPALTTFGIFVVQGLQLRRKEAAAALSASGAIAYGLAAILLLTPLLGLAAVQLPLQPPALALGLGVFCCMPTALSSGVTFTQQLGGNVSLALLLTISSNILGIFTMPFILPHILAAAPITHAAASAGGLAATSAAGPVLEPLPLLVQLVQTILLPTLLGATIRGVVPGAAAFIDARRKLMSYVAAALLAMVPWMQARAQPAASMCCNICSAAYHVAAWKKLRHVAQHMWPSFQYMQLRLCSCLVKTHAVSTCLLQCLLSPGRSARLLANRCHWMCWA